MAQTGEGTRSHRWCWTPGSNELQIQYGLWPKRNGTQKVRKILGGWCGRWINEQESNRRTRPSPFPGAINTIDFCSQQHSQGPWLAGPHMERPPSKGLRVMLVPAGSLITDISEYFDHLHSPAHRVTQSCRQNFWLCLQIKTPTICQDGFS